MGGVQFFTTIPQRSVGIVERLGRYNRTMKPGFHLMIPYLDRLKTKVVLKEQSINVDARNCVTKDNVFVHITGNFYYRIVSPYKYQYGSNKPIEYTRYLASALTRSEIGKMSLDKTFEERARINTIVMSEVDEAAQHWGLQCTRFEIKDI